jgi:hypothetical protein
LRGYLKHGPVVRAEQPIEVPIAPLPTAVVDANTRSVTTNSVESVSAKQITAAPLLTTSDPQASPLPQETRSVATINASDPPGAIDSSDAAAAQVEIVPAPAKSRDAEVNAVVLQSPPKEIKMPEVRRAEPADEPEVRRAELARSNEGPAKVKSDRTSPPSQQTNSRAKTEPSRDIEAKATETTSLVLKRTDSKPEVTPQSPAVKTERPAKPKRWVNEKGYLLPGHEFEEPPIGRLPRGTARGRFVGETADGKWTFELPSREIVTVVPPTSPP